ncbi:MAG: hypothetical protein KAI81_09285, partial [Candidatus Marinimicrobia bacterium]|nr:hypothetical protein [Candidatus Neomarinimicrobiota bacterium]
PDFLKTCKDNYYYETIYNGKDGKQISVGISKYAFYDDKNNIINRSQIIRDLTEHEILEKQMLQSEKLITIGHLAAGLAHEIGNPLTSISSLAQLTKRKSEDQIVIANLEKIIVNIKRISKIVRQMVDFSRPSKANANISDINEIIGSAVGIFHYDTRAKDTKIHMNLDSKIPDLWADPDQIHQIILNMLINAVDANEGTGQNVYIETYCYQDTINISIRDEGPGVPDAIKENIFEPFFTTKEVGKGTGLGLAVSHGIIRNLGGRIDIVDAEEGGAMFIIKLPKARKE